jgi:hypothetical protein
MRTLAEDTTPEAEKVLIQLLREATPARKMEMVESANRTARMLAMAGLREQFPHESEVQLRRRLADLLLGPELAAKVYGPFPDNESEVTSCDRENGGGVGDG